MIIIGYWWAAINWDIEFPVTVKSKLAVLYYSWFDDDDDDRESLEILKQMVGQTGVYDDDDDDAGQWLADGTFAPECGLTNRFWYTYNPYIASIILYTPVTSELRQGLILVMHSFVCPLIYMPVIRVGTLSA